MDDLLYNYELLFNVALYNIVIPILNDSHKNLSNLLFEFFTTPFNFFSPDMLDFTFPRFPILLPPSPLTVPLALVIPVIGFFLLCKPYVYA